MPLATVREAIEFSARTRLPENMNMFTKMKKVDEVLKLLDLERECFLCFFLLF